VERVVSRETGALGRRVAVRGEHLNGYCRVPGSPFAGTLHLVPNLADEEATEVSFGPMDMPAEVDTFTFFWSYGVRRHGGQVAVVTCRALAGDGGDLAEQTTRLGAGEQRATSMRFRRPDASPVGLSVHVVLEPAAGETDRGAVRLQYLLAYPHNPLVHLTNAAGTDKGTEIAFGKGVPHCYAIAYHEFFAPFRTAEFSLLEIGLQNGSGDERPVDAPSLRVWREFFPRARIVGYDINDFNAFSQEGTATVRGDQSSREDLARLLAEHSQPPFRVVIDDGSHASSHQQISLAGVFPHVAPGGIYVIEDLHWQPFVETPTTLEVLRGYLERRRIESPWMRDNEARELEASIASVEILRPNDAEIAVIRRREDAGY